ncbi:GroES (chaperonin 10)-like protein [Pseudocohnilembus persalinus]|uniref:GroES (Chaperonin 10)-like protein n=1 Tax=Pseudocohnilembus persalinus TaxID=266149 RepID=A0A0V0QS09_PSEPJ|nr:GroES (chaperonin 10)-like protein [Pseudocohnilembus persalinus]|eukprot:KRX05067.1 GroES (chaperonin 10)-like protein [Pseudocohnilembus persalinus]
MTFEIPKKIKGIVIKKEGQKPEYGEIDVPELKEGDILVKVEAAPINPSDLGSLQGKNDWFPMQYPYIPGKEASGTVVAAKGEKQQQLIGKRIGCFTNLQGTLGGYGEYCIKQILILPDDINFDIGSCSVINPLTVSAMLETVKKLNSKAVVHNVGASQIGRQMEKLFNANGIQVINIVRREEQVKGLKEQGSKYVLNQSSEDFWQVFQLLAQELQANIAFDAIGGDYCAELIKNMPRGSTIFIYGLLSEQRISNIDLLQCLLEDKTVKGFVVFYELQKFTQIQFEEISQKVASELKTTFSTQIASKIKQQYFEKGLDNYLKQMSTGKIILIP